MSIVIGGDTKKPCMVCKEEIKGSSVTMESQGQEVAFHPNCLNKKEVKGPGIYFKGNIKES